MTAPNRRAFLAVAPQYTPTRDLLSAAARRRGLEVEVLPARGGAGELRGRRGGHYYGGPGFASGVVGDLGIALLEPSDTWLSALPTRYTGRRVVTTDVATARALTGPAFIKPPSDKSFPAGVYGGGGAAGLPRDPSPGLPPGLPPDLPPRLPVQVSEVVGWAAEFRLFVVDGEVRTGSQYATFGHLDAVPLDGHRHRAAALEFADRLLADQGATLPGAVVVDIGLLSTPDHGTGDNWAVVEANMAWFSTCYAAEPDRALDAVLRAAGPREDVPDRDLPFVSPSTVPPTRPHP
ncbi:ATP-grasp domain-containing protein [Streptomyces sp. NPDC091292]|uniref:ATP-grasp domain-containing protein n=1 Tax=Streptomyces sp. NPDC091292 TaxID=3365991 RepID=UPI00382776C5